VLDPIEIYGTRKAEPTREEPTPFRKKRTVVLDPIEIYGTRKGKEDESWPYIDPRSQHPWPTYTGRAIKFKEASVLDKHPRADFVDDSYLGDIDQVVKILDTFPSFYVTLQASVGIWGHGGKVPSLQVLQIVTPLLGHSKETYDAYGPVMDARAKRVRDELVRRGISADRIHLGRGEARLGEDYRTVDFIFDLK
jgi:hypothetical protein